MKKQLPSFQKKPDWALEKEKTKGSEQPAAGGGPGGSGEVTAEQDPATEQQQARPLFSFTPLEIRIS